MDKIIKNKINIGIYGFGFVGKAVAQGFTPIGNVRIYDVKEKIDSFEETINKSEILFICLPTPMANGKSGKINLSIINNEIKRIAKYLDLKSSKIIIIKSTVIPGTTRRYQNLYPKLNFVFNPEFLTEKASRLDFINASRIILGGKSPDDPNVLRIEKIYRARFLSTPIFKTNFETAEFTKYLCNNFFVQKVMYFNEQKIVTEKFNENTGSSSAINWDEAIKLLLADGRIGNSHYQVPGLDNHYGFGGACFPKDLCAYRNWAMESKGKTPILDTIWEYNKKIRKHKGYQ